MNVKKCDSCLSYCLSTIAPCPACAGTNFTYLSSTEASKIPEESIIREQSGSTKPGYRRPLETHNATVQGAADYLSLSRGNESSNAINSARIVDGYGTYIQYVGIILGILQLIVATWAGGKAGYVAVGLFVGLVIGITTVIFALINGAFFRMIANYIIARLKS